MLNIIVKLVLVCSYVLYSNKMIIFGRLKIRHVTVVNVCAFHFKLSDGGANSNDENQTAID